MKNQIIQHLKAKIEQELGELKKIYETARAHATEDDLQSEGKYDTRRVEASYLASAQRKRVEELEQELQLIDEMDLEHTGKILSVGSLVTLEHNGLTRRYFISSTAGGTMVQLEGETILCLSAFSPIGSAAIGLEVGDQFEVEMSEAPPRVYTIKDLV